MFDHQPRADQIDPQNLAPQLWRGLEHTGAPARDARVGKGDVELPVMRFCGVHQCDHIGLQACIHLHRHGLPACGDHRLGGVVHSLGFVTQHQARALLGKQQGGSAANARARTGDDGHLALELCGHTGP